MIEVIVNNEDGEYVDRVLVNNTEELEEVIEVLTELLEDEGDE